MAKSYAIVIGAVLTLVGILGFIRGQAGMTMMGMSLQFSLIHNVIHLATGLLGLALGFAGGGKHARAFAQVFGVIYTLVAVLGFAHAPGFVVSMLNLNTSYNMIHLVVGLLGLLAGFAAPGQKPAMA
jgi:hypothetical protein